MAEKRFLSRDDILSINDLPTEDVFIPEWQAYVRVRGLTAAERDAFEASIVKRRGQKTEMDLRNMRARIVAMCVVDEQGNRIFSDQDAEALGRKSASALDRIFEVAQRLSGLRTEDVEELGNS